MSALCPVCRQHIEEVNWKADLVRTGGKILDGVFIPPGPLEERVISVPPGRYQVRPCGHAIDLETALALVERAGAEKEGP